MDAVCTNSTLLKKIAEDFILAAGCNPTKEESHPDVFGSYFAVYARAGHEVRFIWDGKDGWGYLEHRPAGTTNWEPVGSPVPEGPEDKMRAAALNEWPEALSAVLSS